MFVAYADSQVGQLFRAFVLIGPFHFQMMRYAGRTDYFFRSNIALGIVGYYLQFTSLKRHVLPHETVARQQFRPGRCAPVGNSESAYPRHGGHPFYLLAGGHSCGLITCGETQFALALAVHEQFGGGVGGVAEDRHMLPVLPVPMRQQMQCRLVLVPLRTVEPIAVFGQRS